MFPFLTPDLLVVIYLVRTDPRSDPTPPSPVKEFRRRLKVGRLGVKTWVFNSSKRGRVRVKNECVIKVLDRIIVTEDTVTVGSFLPCPDPTSEGRIFI